MPWDWPVDVNYLEAKAFCTWKAQRTGRSIRLPTEAEWTCMRDWAFPRYADGAAAVSDQPFWQRAPGNVNLEHWASACPVDRFAFGGSGLYDVVGNVWQHTETPIRPFPGFAPHALYDDFSVPTFDGRHHLLMGGSFISTGNEALRSARYAFRRHFMQHAGFRYVESDAPLPLAEDAVFTEDDPLICAAIHEHFALRQPLDLPNYGRALADAVVHAVDAAALSGLSTQSDSRSSLSAAEVGCGVGRTCFELALSGRFSAVMGIDRSARTVRLAAHLQHSDAGLPYCLLSEGELQSFHEVSLAASGLHLSKEQRRSLRFVQGDADNLGSDERLRSVDVLVLNLVLEQLQAPADFLRSVHQRVAPGGLLLLATSFAWSERRTPKERWLGGRRENGEALSSAQALEDLLRPTFAPMPAETRELLRPVHEDRRRSSVHAVSVTAWRRR